ncbi:GNAT family N-acetyltransferase [Paenibacillus chartarius]|uniref:GNAT family N-acetyltransferase n=1 Tax=Paenibacillus chartarius TaxID=747481 RepID=A0ABV6DM77_9BACL
MLLKTDRLILREFTKDDWEQFHAYASDADLVRFMEWGPNSEAATKDYLDRMIRSQKQQPREIY